MKITPQSPARLQGRPLNALIIIIKGTQCVCFWIRVCVCARARLCVTNPLTSYHTLLSSPSKEPWVSLCPQGQRSGDEGPAGSHGSQFPQCDRVFATAGGHCVSVWGPAGLSAKTSSQWAYSQWTGNPSLLYLGQTELVCVCERERKRVLLCVVIKVCVNSMVPMSWGILPTRRWDGKVFEKRGEGLLLK